MVRMKTDLQKQCSYMGWDNTNYQNLKRLILERESSLSTVWGSLFGLHFAKGLRRNLRWKKGNNTFQSIFQLFQGDFFTQAILSFKLNAFASRKINISFFEQDK